LVSGLCSLRSVASVPLAIVKVTSDPQLGQFSVTRILHMGSLPLLVDFGEILPSSPGARYLAGAIGANATNLRCGTPDLPPFPNTRCF
jgi:hypothetical protein